jgi:hypothetical protein
MRISIFIVTILFSSYSLACSVTPMAYSNWTVDAVMRALSEDSTVASFEVVSMVTANRGSEFTTVLKNDEVTKTRVYSVTEGPYAEGQPECGKWTATLLSESTSIKLNESVESCKLEALSKRVYCLEKKSYDKFSDLAEEVACFTEASQHEVGCTGGE